MRFVVAYVAVAIVFFGLDFLWLSRFALGMYRREIGPLLLDQPNLAISSLFYLVFVFGLVLLVVLPALDGGNWLTALWMGALLGLVAYGTYDITNLATLKGWSQTVALADLAWGTALSAVASTVGFFVVSALRL
jgi:uncharacterized membrane protein